MTTLRVEAFEAVFDDQIERIGNISKTINEVRKTLFTRTTHRIVRMNEKSWKEHNASGDKRFGGNVCI